jgi:hypothetical protein
MAITSNHPSLRKEATWRERIGIWDRAGDDRIDCQTAQAEAR